jgi:iron(II)-dependent oxidoreductase
MIFILTRLALVAGVGAGLAAAAVVAWKFWRRRVARQVQPRTKIEQRAAIDELDELDSPVNECHDIGSLVDGMLAHGRYALLLRRQLVSNLAPEQFHAARESLERQMSLVPEGDVTLGGIEKDDEESESGTVFHVGGLFLDRYAVTNREYRQFVANGGYEQMAIWDPQIWPAVLDFVDTTGTPGPRFWKNGRYAPGEDHRPVVGVSWYEASAYARWVGKRLPSEAEWVKAGSWPVPISASQQVHRKFPWGETMDHERCNLWGSGLGHTVPVTEYASGVSVGGAYQLIGNVWEWTTGNFGTGECSGRDLTLPVPMKSIHGGAFDTYFEHQATCQFQSGESPLSRKHNIGFRCALSICDVAAAPHSRGDDEFARPGSYHGGGDENPGEQATQHLDQAAELVATAQGEDS